MTWTKWIFLIEVLGLARQGLAQAVPKLPAFEVDRVRDSTYMINLTRTVKQQLQTLTRQPQTARNDTLRFSRLYYLGRIYKVWPNRKDSTLYFGYALIREAQKSRNLIYEVNGTILLEDYYHTVQQNTPKALRLNFDILTLLEKATRRPGLSWRINVNLGDLYALSKDYPNALRYLDQAKRILAETPNYDRATRTNLQIDIEQHIGSVYNKQGKFAESEAHYRAAEALLANDQSKATHGYVYDDLAELYMKYGYFDKALPYARKAETIWQGLRPTDASNSWGTLAYVYFGLKQDERAMEYAQKVLQLKKPSNSLQEQAYFVLYQLYERRKDWENSAAYFRKYIAARDTIIARYQSEKLTTLQKQDELARMALQNQQARQLQTAQLLNVQKQAELDRLRALAQAESLTKKAQFTEQKRLLDNERANARLSRQRSLHKLEQETYRQETQFEQRIRRGLVGGLLLLLFFTGALGLSYRRNQRQQHQIQQLNTHLEQTVAARTVELQTANDELRQKNRALREADNRIIQTQESERQRIAADLHDDLGGTLSTLRRKITDGQRQFSQTQTGTLFNELAPLIQKSNDDLRRIAHNLMPPEFARMGLANAIDQLVGAVPGTPTHVEFITSGTVVKLPIPVELNLYRIVSELLTNVQKHAQASRATVQLLYYGDQLSILVEDNGVGIDAEKARKSDGIGLKNSILRADYIGAALHRETNEGGTFILIELPYAATATSSEPGPDSAG